MKRICCRSLCCSLQLPFRDSRSGWRASALRHLDLSAISTTEPVKGRRSPHGRMGQVAWATTNPTIRGDRKRSRHAHFVAHANGGRAVVDEPRI